MIDTVRHALDPQRLRFTYRRLGVRIGGLDPRYAGHWRTLLGSMAIVFACFFVIGLEIHSGGGSQSEAPAPVHVQPSGVAIPVQLAEGPLLDGAIPLAARSSQTAKPASAPAPGGSAASRATSGSQASSSEAAGAATQTTTTTQAEPTRAEPTHSESAAAPAPSQPSSPAPSRTHSSSPSTGGGGGGSFDTSG